MTFITMVVVCFNQAMRSRSIRLKEPHVAPELRVADPPGLDHVTICKNWRQKTLHFSHTKKY